MNPNPPVAGGTLEITLDDGQAQSVHISGPLGSWRKNLKLVEGKATVKLPEEIPVILIGLPDSDRVSFPHSLRIVNGKNSKPASHAYFWKGYILGGFPAPCPTVSKSINDALEAAQAAIKQNPEYLPAKELLWRVEAESAQNKDDFLKRIADELSSHPSGRLALAAIRLHKRLEDPDGALAIAKRYKSDMEPVVSLEANKWAEIISTNDPKIRLGKIHSWLALDPFTDYLPNCLQILAATYSALGDYRSTALFGLLSLKVMPDDAMTLNGVAYAMAEGEFELDHGLTLVGKAMDILAKPELLKKPPQLNDIQWQRELIHARAACLDTKGWLLSKMGRWAEAREALNDAIRLERSDEFYLHLGLTYMKEGKNNEARKALRAGQKLGGPHRRRIESVLIELER